MNAAEKATLANLLPTARFESSLIVSRGSLPEELVADVESANIVKVLVAGQRGMGKTTELRRFETMLQASTEFEPVFLQFGAQETINDALLIYAMATELVNATGVKITKSAPLWRWFDVEESVSSYAESKGGSATLGANLPVIGAKGEIKTTRDSKNTRTRKAIKNKADLINSFNDLLNRAKDKRGKQIVFIVDDIDKIQDTPSVEGTFVSSAHTLGLIDAPCVFTVPYTYATSSFNRLSSLPYTNIHRVPAVAIKSRAGEIQQANVDFMLAVLGRRLETNPFAYQQLVRIIDYSGGVIVDALRLARGVIKQVVMKSTKSIDDLIEDEFQKIADEYRYQLDSPILWQKVQKFCEATDPRMFLAEEGTLDLVLKMIVIEYRDQSTWLGVHPAVRRLYDQNKDALPGTLA